MRYYLTIVALIALLASPTIACETETNTTIYSTDIVLSEVYPAPPTGEEEFIELHNTGNDTIDLTGWILGDSSGKQYAIESSIGETSISPGAYTIVTHTSSRIYLNNSGDSVTLSQPNGTLVDDTTYEEASSASSWALIENEWQWTDRITPREKNISQNNSISDDTTNASTTLPDTETPYQTSDQIFINELLPDPEGLDTTDEWIELVNEGSGSLNLAGWQLTDTNTYYTFENTTLVANEILTVEIGDSKINLNNTGDTVYLIDPYGSIVHGTTYESAESGWAWARSNSDWQWTFEPTPGQVNIFTATENETAQADPNTDQQADTDLLSIDLFRALDDNTTATVEGVVTVLPSVFGSQYFYIQDDTAGIQVYSYKKDFPELKTGDRLTVSGIKSTSRGETRIKTESAQDIQVVASDEKLVSRDVFEITEDLEGMLIHLEGALTTVNSTGGMINDSTALQFKEGAQIDSTILTEGTGLSVQGIVSESNGEYRVLPRGNGDLIQTVNEENWISPAQASGGSTVSTGLQTTKEPPQYGLMILVILGLFAITLGQFIKQHRTNSNLKKDSGGTQLFTPAASRGGDGTSAPGECTQPPTQQLPRQTAGSAPRPESR
ncbi:MAG: hypothetical protein COW24_04305 [Candidatus Kerfeldbacteria bacterium CG15_BIG_FIL_POST_REV_8_21_14_020_45_12]|uniref:LTD domain-containing protein n=1 Tax=Candidatus Kerfeldbacteria bacterium CG15_BIG_FIL_POST_REV_8_21_14_020_45_12 TaxID=2014247 RepID=A0A2M7H377_9BACT|nr:MAG: hypothetical protein COW24_04305 [Candidatus Kerfeldbacteria bacterium CG15_BIG_FIL_POST_REV_8_21_14_020_45_12]PJA93302.1 MAG: hypothetical protein CO132_03680 [Candidatus Kerfeldbacteria bacterium CG_4_9_14_3_um_filter_45_8]